MAKQDRARSDHRARANCQTGALPTAPKRASGEEERPAATKRKVEGARAAASKAASLRAPTARQRSVSVSDAHAKSPCTRRRDARTAAQKRRWSSSLDLGSSVPLLTSDTTDSSVPKSHTALHASMAFTSRAVLRASSDLSTCVGAIGRTPSTAAATKQSVSSTSTHWAHHDCLDRNPGASGSSKRPERQHHPSNRTKAHITCPPCWGPTMPGCAVTSRAKRRAPNRCLMTRG
mmetsp:Transcript_61196/g.138448  ORF Transcript_61196/g.138448 Transcript_61196/m.138448 type:complete len:233 (+) Transcript_61196:337-1035(+)